MKDYIPANDAEFLLWFNNLKNKTLMHGYNVGLSQEDMSEIDIEGETIKQAIQEANTKKEEAAKAITYKNEVRAAFLKKLRKIIARIKAHRNYTNSLGQELGIIGKTASFDASNYKANLSGEVTGGLVKLKFQKKGVDSVNIYYRKKGEVTWRFLARDTRSPYEHRIQLENPAQPEHWEYRAYGVIKDVEIGQPSDVVEVIFGV
ncbi:MAG: hypothetical protein IPJ74_17055 [Saprospiraceae bacterium]|nr:hypothetical protein [Saprospiraceae bacterium]